jgi:hypothetical protein
MSDGGQITERLGAFFTKCVTIRQRDIAPTLIERLSRFCQEFRACLNRDVAAETKDASNPIIRLSPEALNQTLQSLRAPLMSARSSGAFLNVWSIAGLKRDEVRNAAVFASLLDPLICPEIGPAFLWAFLRRIRESGGGSLPNEADIKAGYTVQTEDRPLGNADSRVDLSIEGRDFLLLIEVKIDAGEGLAQLSRYNDVLREKANLLEKRPALVYLSPRPSSRPPRGTFYADWTDVATAARNVARDFQSDGYAIVSTFLRHFAAHVKQFA